MFLDLEFDSDQTVCRECALLGIAHVLGSDGWKCADAHGGFVGFLFVTQGIEEAPMIF